jgi:hypothetical protein
VSGVVGAHRGTPDVSYNGGSGSPVFVYDTYLNSGWITAWGTSASAPQWAGLIAIMDQGRSQAGLQPLNTTAESNLTNYQLQSDLYALSAANFHDVTTGTNFYGNTAGPGYDLVTGLGTPVANLLVPDMVGTSATGLSVSPASPTAFGSVLLTATVTGPMVAPTGSVDFKFGTTDLGTAPVSGGAATLTTTTLPAGPDGVTAYYLGDANYAISNKGQTATVGKAPSSTTLSATLSTLTYGQSDTLTATVAGVSGHTPTGSVDFKFGTTDLGTVPLSGGSAALTVTLPAGSGSVTADYLGDANYLTGNGSTAVSVARAVLGVSANAQTKVYGAAVPTLTYAVTGLVNGDTAAGVLSGALATTATTGSGVGGYAITQGTLALTSANYTLAFTGSTLTVTTAPLTVAANPATKVYGAALPALTYAASGFVNGDTATVVTGALVTTATASSGVGGYPISQGTLAAANYSITFTGNTLTVTPAQLTVTANAGTKVYGAALPALTYAVSGFVNGDTATVVTGALVTTATASSGVGGYPISQGTLAAANYSITFTGNTLTVTSAPLTVTANAQSKVYGAAVPALTFTVGGLVNGDTAAGVLSGALATTAAAGSPVGGYPITLGTLISNTGNYALSFTGSTLTVIPAALGVSANAATKAYGAAVPALTYAVTGLVNGDTAAGVLGGSLATTATTGSPVGGYPITQGTLALTSPNYALAFTGSTLTVTPAPLTVTANAETKVYGAALPALTYAASGFVNGDTAAVLSGTLATTATAWSGVGSYPISQGTLGAANYAITFTAGTLTVTPAPLAVTADAQTKVYGAALPALTYAASGFVNGDTSDVLTGGLATPATASSGVAVYPITQGSLAAGPNYTIAFTGGTLGVTPAPLTVVANPAIAVYGDAVPAPTYSVTGLVNGDTAAGALGGSLATIATAGSPVGGYPITQGMLALTSANYTLAFTGGTLTVIPAPLTVVANAQTKVYGAALPALSYTASGFVNGDTAAVLNGTLATTATAGSGVGSYPITQGNLAAANYTTTFTGSTLTVTPAPLTVTADSRSAPAGQPLPELTDSVTGLVNGDTPAVVTGVTLSTTATTASLAGTYPITVSGGQAANYVLTDRNGTLTLSGGGGGGGGGSGGGGGGGSGSSGSAGLVGSAQYAVGEDTGGGQVTLFNPDGSVRYTVTPFPGFTGGVRVATADFNGDGIADLIAGTGPGGPTHVVVLDGVDQHVLFSIDPFEASFTGGVYVAAGDLHGDGTPDLVITPDEGGGPRVRVFDGKSWGEMADFYGISDPNFRGGARAAVADVNGDGAGDLIVAAGFGGGPRVAGFDGKTLGSGDPQRVFPDFYAFEQTLRNGVFIAAGDINGDGYADIVAGGGPGGGPRVFALSGKDLMAGNQVHLANFFGGDPNSRGGIRVAVKNLDADTRGDIVVGVGSGSGSRVTAYLGKTIPSDGLPATAEPFDAFSGFGGGVFVG